MEMGKAKINKAYRWYRKQRRIIRKKQGMEKHVSLGKLKAWYK